MPYGGVGGCTFEDNVAECEEEGETEYENILIEKALTINGGRLEVKEGK